MLNILSWILTGLLVGALARLLMPGRQPIGLVATILLGVAGAFVGGLIASLFTTGDPLAIARAEDWHAAEWLMSVVGGVVVLGIYLALVRPRTDTTVPPLGRRTV